VNFIILLVVMEMVERSIPLLTVLAMIAALVVRHWAPIVLSNQVNGCIFV